MTELEDRILKYGLRVLYILENSRNWNGNTLDMVGLEAQNLSLAEDDDDGFFQRTPEVVELHNDPDR